MAAKGIERQAREKYLSGDYKLGTLNFAGQRISIRVTIPRRDTGSKEKYAKEGVHKGMQGWICYDKKVRGYWLANFPQYGAKSDIATLAVKEENLKIIPVMHAIINEQIKAQFEALEKDLRS